MAKEPSAVTGRGYDGAMGKKQRASAARTSSADQRAIAEGLSALDAALEQLWESIRAGDVLGAEVQASEMLALPGMADDSDESHVRVVTGLIRRAASVLEPPEQAAFLRLLVALGTKAVKRRASDELADLADDGVYPPEWVTDIGKAVPGQAYRARDAFGEQELVAVSFSYGDAEHMIAVALDLAELPTVVLAGVNTNSGKFFKEVEGDETFGGRLEPIAVAEARQRVEGPLANYGSDPDYGLDPTSMFALPLIRARLRRLPAPDPGASATYTAADRAAAVADFEASPFAAEAGHPDVARFWAQVLTGYSSRVPGEAPATVGRHRLAAALVLHVPRTFLLSPEQRDGMRQAVTAWTRWAAARQGIDEESAGALMTHLDVDFGDFPAAYDAPESSVLRGYVQDLATPDVDLAWLAEARARRELAAPPPDDRHPDDEDADPADPAGRAVLVASEFGSCDLEGADADEFMAAVTRVAEELWRDDPPATWQKGKSLLAKGHDPHDVIHLLVEATSW